MSQFPVPCSVYRGGTSRGLMFHKRDLPADATARNKIFLDGIDAYNPSQVNGLGGTSSSTSKVCVVSPSTIEGVDGDWTFYQVGTGEPVVDDKGTCGNMMAAVGAGIYSDLQEAAENMVKVRETIEPRMDVHEQYQFYLERYMELYPKVRDSIHQLVDHEAAK